MSCHLAKDRKTKQEACFDSSKKSCNCLRDQLHILTVGMASKQSFTVKEGYRVIPAKMRKSSEAVHHLYIKKHQTRDSDNKKPIDRTLFVLNVPPFVSESCLERLFGDAGPIKTVYLHDKPTSKLPDPSLADTFTHKPSHVGHKVAYIVYKHASGLEKALDPTFEHIKTFYKVGEKIRTGVAIWANDYGSQYVDEGNLQQEINSFMEQFDTKQQQETETGKEMDGVPDEEGWVTVTKYSRNKGLSRTESNDKKITTKEKKKRAEKELLNFYTFQQRETKRDHIAKLRLKFEEDKLKVEQMKTARKFRPY